MLIKQESWAYFRALGKHVSVLRKEQGLTQAELARLLKVSQQTVFAYELGDRRISVLMLVQLAEIFGISIEALAGITIPVRPKRRVSPGGIRHAERFRQLSKTQQRFVSRIIDVLLEQNSRSGDRATEARRQLAGKSINEVIDNGRYASPQNHFRTR